MVAYGICNSGFIPKVYSPPKSQKPKFYKGDVNISSLECGLVLFYILSRFYFTLEPFEGFCDNKLHILNLKAQNRHNRKRLYFVYCKNKFIFIMRLYLGNLNVDRLYWDNKLYYVSRRSEFERRGGGRRERLFVNLKLQQQGNWVYRDLILDKIKDTNEKVLIRST